MNLISEAFDVMRQRNLHEEIMVDLMNNGRMTDYLEEFRDLGSWS